jgi:hypothetical protein
MQRQQMLTQHQLGKHAAMTKSWDQRSAVHATSLGASLGGKSLIGHLNQLVALLCCGLHVAVGCSKQNH